MANLPEELQRLNFGADLARSLASIGETIGTDRRRRTAEELVNKALGLPASESKAIGETLFDLANMGREGQTGLGVFEAVQSLREREEQQKARARAERRGTQGLVGGERTGLFRTQQDIEGVAPLQVESEPIVPGFREKKWSVAELPGSVRRVKEGDVEFEVRDYGFIDDEGNWRKDAEGNIVKAKTDELNLTQRRGAGATGEKPEEVQIFTSFRRADGVTTTREYKGTRENVLEEIGRRQSSIRVLAEASGEDTEFQLRFGLPPFTYKEGQDFMAVLRGEKKVSDLPVGLQDYANEYIDLENHRERLTYTAFAVHPTTKARIGWRPDTKTWEELTKRK